MIDKSRYEKHRPGREARGHGAIMSNVRFKWIGGGKKTAREARQAFKQMLREREVPKGWAVAVVQWGHPEQGESLEDARRRLKATNDWREGDVSELWEMFSGLFSHYEHELQVGVISGDDDKARLRRSDPKKPRRKVAHGRRGARRKASRKAHKKNTSRLARRGRR